MGSSADLRSAIDWPRAALLVLLGWWTARIVLGTDWLFLDLVNLAFHEAGHLFFGFAGSTVHYLGGTLGQLIVPGGLVAYFLVRRRQPFAAAFCLWWAGESLANVSVYMADARELALPLVGGGDHDWNELFFRCGMLTEPAVARISGLTRLAAVGVMLSALGWGSALAFNR
ncbi:MAG TPA: hypothetical protein VD788_03430 [Candidatus Polarisedimenticolaceae bacterium]|nr:hypothetical protein [Candidatus Polarisedimenticolaceae bacterium]